MKDFKELRVWSKAHTLALQLYKASRSFPQDELYGLTSQLRRSACSIGANIAEGCGRRLDGDFTRFLQIARGSASEVEYHLLLARDLGYLTGNDHRRLEQDVVEIERMLTSLVQRMRPHSGRRAPTGSGSSASAC